MQVYIYKDHVRKPLLFLPAVSWKASSSRTNSSAPWNSPQLFVVIPICKRVNTWTRISWSAGVLVASLISSVGDRARHDIGLSEQDHRFVLLIQANFLSSLTIKCSQSSGKLLISLSEALTHLLSSRRKSSLCFYISLTCWTDLLSIIFSLSACNFSLWKHFPVSETSAGPLPKIADVRVLWSGYLFK